MPHPQEKPFSEKSLSYIWWPAWVRISAQPEQAHEKGFVRGASQRCAHPAQRDFRPSTVILEAHETGPKFAPKFFKIRPDCFPEICAKIRRTFGPVLAAPKNSQPFFCPHLAQKKRYYYCILVMLGNFNHRRACCFVACLCLLCLLNTFVGLVVVLVCFHCSSCCWCSCTKLMVSLCIIWKLFLVDVILLSVLFVFMLIS